jgi:hypothetical protein
VTQDAATLAGLTPGNNAYTITVTGSSIASDLKLIDAATTTTVDALGVGTITGLAADIATAISDPSKNRYRCQRCG